MSDQSTAQDTWDSLTCEVDRFGNLRWYDENGEFHRENGPAVVYAVGATNVNWWYKHGVIHRIDGPAYVDSTGYVEYWINGYRVSKLEFRILRLLRVFKLVRD